MATTVQRFDLINGTALAPEIVRARVEQQITDYAVYISNNVGATQLQKDWSAGILTTRAAARTERDAIIPYVLADSQVGDSMDELAPATLKGIVETAINAHRI